MKPQFQNIIREANDTAELLKFLSPEPTINKTKLDKFYEETNELLNDVISSDIDNDLKIFLYSHLQEIIVTIADFKIKGIKGIKEAVQKTFAEAVMNQPIREKLDSSPFGKRLWNIINTYGVFLSVIIGTIELPDVIQKILPPPKPALVEQNPNHPDDKPDFQKPIPINKNDDEEDLEPPEKKSN